MSETIISEIFNILRKSRIGWAVIIFFLVISALFAFWLSLPEKAKEDYLGYDVNTPPKLEETDTADRNPNLLIKEKNTAKSISDNTDLSSLSKDEIQYRIDKFLKEGKFKETLPLMLNLPQIEKNRELERLFDKVISEGDLDFARSIINEFDYKSYRDNAQNTLNMEEIKQ